MESKISSPFLTFPRPWAASLRRVTVHAALVAFVVASVLASTALAAPSPVPTHPAPADASRLATLASRIRALVASHRRQMRIGVAIIHVPSGQHVEVDATDPYPLASVFKLPVLVELARQIQERRPGVTLERKLMVREQDKCISPSGRLQARPSGTRVSVRECAELMETISDNTATDMIFRLLGTDSVDRLMRGRGLTQGDIFLTNRAAWLITLGASREFSGLGARQIARKWRGMSEKQRREAAARVEEENRGLTLQRFQQMEDASSSRRASEGYGADVAVASAVDNHSSPRDLACFLQMLGQGQLLDRKWTSWCMGVLSRARFNNRIPRLLPRGTRVYHKTGSIVGVVNDAGIIRLPGGEHLVVAVLVQDIRAGADEAASAAIARIARMAWDCWAGGAR